MQLARAAHSRMARYAFLFMMLVVAASFAQTLASFWGHDAGELPSAAAGWAGNADYLGVAPWAVLVFFLLFIVSSSAFADTLYLDVRCRAAGCVATRTTTARYVWATACAAALAAFVVVLVPLLLSQALALLVFPASAPDGFVTSFNDAASMPDVFGTGSMELLLWDLRWSHPYLHNLIFICYDALWAAIMAAASVAVSLYTRRSRLVVLGAPTLVYLLSLFVLPRWAALSNYLYPGAAPETSLAFMALAPLAATLAVVAAIAWALARGRDVLL
ncbi:hypothetical protein [Thermophilibacter provencensis]|uniref:ABC transporter permease n=1 Tax=Thermophilibacter provencensis TaxID=1852386 RepID=A0ABT7V5C0_9ACTN|nr:hypothetical protein [Thermophilibacter provencensis]MDM8271801.1 hypothetical protein [Thermophilibacter provencensis]